MDFWKRKKILEIIFLPFFTDLNLLMFHNDIVKTRIQITYSIDLFCIICMKKMRISICLFKKGKRKAQTTEYNQTFVT